MVDNIFERYPAATSLALGTSVGASLAGSVVVAREFRQLIGGAEPGYHTTQAVGMPDYASTVRTVPYTTDHLGLDAAVYLPLAALTTYAALKYFVFERGS